MEVLTVDNHADGPYIYLKLLKEDPARAAEVLELLKMNEGNSSGPGHRLRQLGRRGARRPVLAPPLLRQCPRAPVQRDLDGPVRSPHGPPQGQKAHVTGRCAGCRWLDVCGGNFRVRAEAVTGDLWAPDPACYLTDEEIG